MQRPRHFSQASVPSDDYRFHVEDLTYSPIRGPEGNIEYLVHLRKCEGAEGKKGSVLPADPASASSPAGPFPRQWHRPSLRRSAAYSQRVLPLALSDAYVEHGSIDVLRKANGIDSGSMTKTILDAVKES